MNGKLRVGVLISGRGSNMQALIDACAEPDFPAEIVLVVSNRADAGGLSKASSHGIATAVVDHKKYNDRKQFEDSIIQILEKNDVELVCLAGFMRLLTPHFVARWMDKLVNIHPSLLPSFKGLDTHARVLDAGVRFTGCTVHFVRPEMDDGPIIVQAAVPVSPDDDPDSLADRVLQAEHRAYPMALRLIAEGRVRVDGDCVVIDGWEAPEYALLNPPD